MNSDELRGELDLYPPAPFSHEEVELIRAEPEKVTDDHAKAVAAGAANPFWRPAETQREKGGG